MSYRYHLTPILPILPILSILLTPILPILSILLDTAYTMIEDAVNIELEYGRYLMDQFPIMGVTPELMEQTVHNYANDRLTKIGLDPIFEQSNTTYLQKLVTKHLEMNEVKSNFFESNVSNYAKSSIDLNDF